MKLLMILLVFGDYELSQILIRKYFDPEWSSFVDFTLIFQANLLRIFGLSFMIETIADTSSSDDKTSLIE